MKPNKQLEVGIAVEMEHTKDPKEAEKIAMDHIKETADYYTRLYKARVIDEPEALALAKKYFGDWDTLTELLQDERVVDAGNFTLEKSANDYNLIGKVSKDKFGTFIKGSSGYIFKTSNPLFNFFRYRGEPFKDLDEIISLTKLIKKKY